MNIKASMKAVLVKAALLITVILCVNNLASAQEKKSESPIYTAVQHSASFQGGIKAFYEYLAKSIHYPEAARKANIQGKVITTFVVEEDGSLSNVTVLRGIGNGCDEEAVRVLKASPRWNPGTQGGKTVRQQYTVPINFSLAAK